MAVSRASQSTIKQRLDKRKNFTAGIPPVLGRYESIATVNLSSASAASVEFTSLPSGFQHLQLRMIVADGTNSTGNDWYVQLNGDSSVNSYTDHYLQGNGSAASAAGAATGAYSGLGPLTVPGTGNTSTFAATIVDFLDYASTSKNKTMRAFHGYDLNGSGKVGIHSSLFLSTSAISSIKVYRPSANTARYSHVALYGIRS